MSVLYSKPVLVILGLILLIFTYNLFGLLGKMRETIRNKRGAEDKFMELTANKEKLDHDISKLNTTEGVEENIREKFGLVKEGEGVVIIVEDKKEEKLEMKANTGGILHFFKNLFK